MNRRGFVCASAAGLVTLAHRHHDKASTTFTRSVSDRSRLTRVVTIDAKPAPIQVDLAKTAFLIVDMQNDFGAEGGMMHRAGIDISGIQAVVEPAARALSAARDVGIKAVYLKMAFRPDLSDLGPPGAPTRERHLALGVGTTIRAPNGAGSRILIRDTWNTDILPRLTPRPGDAVVYKHRFSGFFETRLDSVLKELGVTYVIVTGCTTSVCVESTVRDATFRDYSCIVLSDCVAEPLGHSFGRTNHDASLLVFENFAWVARSDSFIGALSASSAGAQPR